MEEALNYITSAPGLIFAISLVVFLITFVLILKRFVGFIVTLILFFLCVGAAYSLIKPQQAAEYIGEYAKNPRLKEWLEPAKKLITPDEATN